MAAHPSSGFRLTRESVPSPQRNQGGYAAAHPQPANVPRGPPRTSRSARPPQQTAPRSRPCVTTRLGVTGREGTARGNCDNRMVRSSLAPLRQLVESNHQIRARPDVPNSILDHLDEGALSRVGRALKVHDGIGPFPVRLVDADRVTRFDTSEQIAEGEQSVAHGESLEGRSRWSHRLSGHFSDLLGCEVRGHGFSFRRIVYPFTGTNTHCTTSQPQWVSQIRQSSH